MVPVGQLSILIQFSVYYCGRSACRVFFSCYLKNYIAIIISLLLYLQFLCQADYSHSSVAYGLCFTYFHPSLRWVKLKPLGHVISFQTKKIFRFCSWLEICMINAFTQKLDQGSSRTENLKIDTLNGYSDDACLLACLFACLLACSS